MAKKDNPPDRPTRAERKAAREYRDEMTIRQLRDINRREAKREQDEKDKK